MTLVGGRARMGFADAAKAEQLITADLGLDLNDSRDETVLAAIAGAADPDLALTGRGRAGGGRGRRAGHPALRTGVPAAADRGARLQRGPGRSPGPASGRRAAAAGRGRRTAA